MTYLQQAPGRRPNVDLDRTFLGQNNSNEQLGSRQRAKAHAFGVGASLRRSSISRQPSNVTSDVDRLLGRSIVLQLGGEGQIGPTSRGKRVVYVRRSDIPADVQPPPNPAIRMVQAAVRGPLLHELKQAVETARAENWDGSGARPASSQAYEFAVRFALMLPATFPDPEASVDTDGDISFEWYRGPRQVFAVSLNSAGVLHYAGLFGPNSSSGAETLSESVPDSVTLGLARVLHESAV